jgi:hypothetical protein
MFSRIQYDPKSEFILKRGTIFMGIAILLTIWNLLNFQVHKFYYHSIYIGGAVIKMSQYYKYNTQ